MAERRYRLTMIAAGDYLFPSNDGRQLWRVARYKCTLPSAAGTFWSAARFRGGVVEAERLIRVDPETLLDWGEWEVWETSLATRAEAIGTALRAGKQELLSSASDG